MKRLPRAMVALAATVVLVGCSGSASAGVPHLGGHAVDTVGVDDVGSDNDRSDSVRHLTRLAHACPLGRAEPDA